METSVATKESATSTSKRHKGAINGHEYSIYNFFRANTGFAIAVVSGIVTVSLFIFRYASTLYNYAYLRFWGIDIAYARQEDSGIFYMALGVFLYYCLLMISQFLLGNTTTVYSHRNRVYLAVKVFQKKLTTKRRANKKIKKRLHKQLKKEKHVSRKRRLIERISKVEARILKLRTSRADKKAIYAYKTRLIVMTSISIVASFLLCMIGAWILSVNYEDSIKREMFLVLTIAPVLLGLLLFILQKRPKIDSDQEVMKELEQFLREVQEDKAMLFPVEAWVKNGIKYFLTNNAIGVMVAQYLVTAVTCIMVLASFGDRHAKELREFRVWTDGVATYAIIYDNGTEIIMESINIQGDSVVIDTSSQRIIKPDDLSYEIYIFDTIKVTRNDSRKNTIKGINAETKFFPRPTIDPSSSGLQTVCNLC